jgi:hypothetical protein
MAIENKSFSGLDGSFNRIADTLLTVPAGTSYAITTIIICNTFNPDPLDPDNGEGDFDLHLIPEAEVTAAGSVADAVADNNRVIKDLNLKAGESYSFDSEKLILEAGDVIAVLGTTSDLSATVSYLEI